MPKATARHILVDSEKTCLELKRQLQKGADFEALAREKSKCPSGRTGGDLGEFSCGQMVPEFDNAVFSGELNEILGPIETPFGYHLLEVTSRSD